MIIKLLGVALAEILAYSLLKTYKPEYAPLSEVCAVGVLFVLCLDELRDVLSFAAAAFENAGIDVGYFTILLKILGVTVLCQIAANLARDNAQSALASKIEFGGKVAVLSLSLPVLKAILGLVSEMIG